MNDFEAWLLSQVCSCGNGATHRQSGRLVCSEHLNPSTPAFALNS